MKTLAIILFIAMYVGLIAFPKRRAIIALVVAGIYIVTGILPYTEVLEVVDWNVLLMIFGTLLLVDYFIESKMPNLIADKLLDLAPNVGNMTIQNVQFSLKDTVKGQEEARQLALQYAREKAESIAKEMNISLGKVTSIVDNSYGGVFRATANTISASKMMAFEEADEGMAMGGVNLEQGTTEVTVSVNVSYEIK